MCRLCKDCLHLLSTPAFPAAVSEWVLLLHLVDWMAGLAEVLQALVGLDEVVLPLVPDGGRRSSWRVREEIGGKTQQGGTEMCFTFNLRQGFSTLELILPNFVFLRFPIFAVKRVCNK